MIEDGWMDGTPDGDDLGTVLKHLGVRGAWLKKLAGEPNLTVETVREEWESLRQDPRVRNPTAVLVSRLRDTLNVRVGSGPMSGNMQDCVRRLENLRRNMRREDTA